MNIHEFILVLQTLARIGNSKTLFFSVSYYNSMLNMFLETNSFKFVTFAPLPASWLNWQRVDTLYEEICKAFRALGMTPPSWRCHDIPLAWRYKLAVS